MEMEREKERGKDRQRKISNLGIRVMDYSFEQTRPLDPLLQSHHMPPPSGHHQDYYQGYYQDYYQGYYQDYYQGYYQGYHWVTWVFVFLAEKSSLHHIHNVQPNSQKLGRCVK